MLLCTLLNNTSTRILVEVASYNYIISLVLIIRLSGCCVACNLTYQISYFSLVILTQLCLQLVSPSRTTILFLYPSKQNHFKESLKWYHNIIKIYWCQWKVSLYWLLRYYILTSVFSFFFINIFLWQCVWAIIDGQYKSLSPWNTYIGNWYSKWFIFEWLPFFFFVRLLNEVFRQRLFFFSLPGKNDNFRSQMMHSMIYI